jgi:hypothetical protein
LLTRVDLISTRMVAALGRSCSRSHVRLCATSLPPLAILGVTAAVLGSNTTPHRIGSDGDTPQLLVALAAEAELAAAREHERAAVRTHHPQATEWMVTVQARGVGLDSEDEGARDAILTRLEHASASIGVAPGCLWVTLTVEASIAADAPRIGGWMVRSALAACGFDAPSDVLARWSSQRTDLVGGGMGEQTGRPPRPPLMSSE